MTSFLNGTENCSKAKTGLSITVANDGLKCFEDWNFRNILILNLDLETRLETRKISCVWFHQKKLIPNYAGMEIVSFDEIILSC